MLSIRRPSSVKCSASKNNLTDTIRQAVKQVADKRRIIDKRRLSELRTFANTIKEVGRQEIKDAIEILGYIIPHSSKDTTPTPMSSLDEI